MALSNDNKKDETPTTSVIGFGTNYFHALGGTTEISLSLQQDECDEGQEENTVPARILTRPTLEGRLCQSPTSCLQCDCHCLFNHRRSRLSNWNAAWHRRHFSTPRRSGISSQVCRNFRWSSLLYRTIGTRHWCRQLGRRSLWTIGIGQSRVVPRTSPNHSGTSCPQALGTNTRVQQVAAGAWHALALLDNGTCMAWGSNRKLQCGISPAAKSNGGPPTICTPQGISFFGKLSKVTAGRQHSLGVEKETGRVYAWGASHFGQCGQYSRKTSIAPPRLVEALQKVVVVDIAAGDTHSLALTGGGRVFCWGSGMDGQLGLGGVVPLSRPKLISRFGLCRHSSGQGMEATTATTTATTCRTAVSFL